MACSLNDAKKYTKRSKLHQVSNCHDKYHARLWSPWRARVRKVNSSEGRALQGVSRALGRVPMVGSPQAATADEASVRSGSRSWNTLCNSCQGIFADGSSYSCFDTPTKLHNQIVKKRASKNVDLIAAEGWGLAFQVFRRGPILGAQVPDRPYTVPLSPGRST